MDYKQRKIDPNANRIVRREKISDGITRIFWQDGGATDICVSNEAGGPMDFQHRLLSRSRG